jgi:hypothetical protein
MKDKVFLLLGLFITLIVPKQAISSNEPIMEVKNKILILQKVSDKDLSFESLKLGLRGFKRICDSLHVCFRYLCIADFILPSTEKRLYVIDMKDSTLIHIDYVAHGRNSGNLVAKNFSNDLYSFQSSLGFYLVSESYTGKHGLSLRLDGLDKGFNDKARQRAIVIHAAEYAEPAFISCTGRLGRSLGCPALPKMGLSKIANQIEAKSIFFIYFPQKEYLKKSVWLKQDF